MPDLSGQYVGRYHIIEPLGEGGMAVVYKAYDTRLEREVAIKFIRRRAISDEQAEKVLIRFEREAKRMARFTHPNIVSIIDYGEYEGSPYLVMEYLPGGMLKNRTGTPMPFQEAAHILAPIARALEYAHEQNTIHRDVKPANILLTNKGQPMLTDFGVAKILDLDEGKTLTGTGVGVGTPKYMAPEQWMNQISPQTDIYALGSVFYELVTGRVPYDADTPAAVLLKQNSEPLARPRDFVPDLPEEVERVIFKALAKKPDERYADMGEFATALEQLVTLSSKIQIIPLHSTILSGEASPSTTPIIQHPPQSPEPTADLKQGISPTFDAGIQSALPSAPEIKPTIKTTTETSQVQYTMPSYPPKKKMTAIITVIGIFVVLLAVVIINFLLPKPASAPNPQETAIPSSTPVETPRNLFPGIPEISEIDQAELIFIPAGEFLMGSIGDDQDASEEEKPQHKVYLDSFWIDRTEVTNRQYKLCVMAGTCREPQSKGSRTRNGYFLNLQYENYPVIWMDWSQAQSYCRWAGRRLPSEAEWEKAARGADGRKYPWGNNNPTCELSNFRSSKFECVGDTSAVGSYPAGVSVYGAVDMAGNVAEWVIDWHGSDYYMNSPFNNPPGPDKREWRVLRGGSWFDDSKNIRAAARNGDGPEIGIDNRGFRCAR